MGVFSGITIRYSKWSEDLSKRVPFTKEEQDLIDYIEVIPSPKGFDSRSAKVYLKDGGHFERTLDKDSANRLCIGDRIDKSRCFLTKWRMGNLSCDKMHYKAL